MDTYIPLSTAAQIAKIPENHLRNLLQVGKIGAVKTSTGEILVSENGLSSFVFREQFADLEGIPISMGDACRKYHLLSGTISRWKAKGYLRVLGTEGQKVLLDESDVAYYAEIHNNHGGFGRWTVRKAHE